jgi:hypothetical protein
MTIEERLEALEKQVQRNKDYNEIQNLMGRYEFFHSCGQDSYIARNLFAYWHPDANSEYGPLGVFDAQGSVDFFDNQSCMMTDGTFYRPAKGNAIIHQVTTPCIEIAEDGKTAKGTWLSIGGELMGGEMYMGPMIAPGEELPKDAPKPPMPPEMPKEKPDGPPPKQGSGFRIDFAYYAEDFVKDENGKWWILHHHVCDRWTAELDTDFIQNVKSGAKKARAWMTQEQIDAAKEGPKKPGAQASAPTTYHYELDNEHGIPYFPMPPEPYTTLSEAKSFLPQDWVDDFDFIKKYMEEQNK